MFGRAIGHFSGAVWVCLWGVDGFGDVWEARGCLTLAIWASDWLRRVDKRAFSFRTFFWVFFGEFFSKAGKVEGGLPRRVVVLWLGIGR